MVDFGFFRSLAANAERPENARRLCFVVAVQREGNGFTSDILNCEVCLVQDIWPKRAERHSQIDPRSAIIHEL
jgi:hypothetical protein